MISAHSARRRVATSLTIFRIKPGITDHDEIIADRGSLRSYPVRLEGTLLGIVYAQRNPLREPKWRRFFDGVVEFQGIDLRTAAAAAVLIIQRPTDAVFAITFGYGRWMIKEIAIESQWGFRVALNAINPASIRSIDHTRLEAISRQTREQLSRASRLEHFGLDIERDLLRAVAGTARDQSLARRLAGADPLVVIGNYSLVSVGSLVDRVDQIRGETTYKQDFGFIDLVSEITDPSEKGRLDKVLVSRLRRKTPELVWLAPPEVVNWDEIEGFRYHSRAGATLYDDLDLADYYVAVRPRQQLTTERLQNDRIRCFNATTGTDRPQWSVYRCLVAEVNIKNETYILSEGKWYNVQRDYVANIDAAIAALQRSSAQLPPYGQGSEQAYNLHVREGDPDNFALLDRKLVGSVSRGKVEVCDLYTRHRQWIHVKRYAGSGVLSHLFNQGVVSADLFQADRNFRQEFNDLLPAAYKLSNPAAAISAADYEIAYAIITPRNRQLRLPFFSRVTLRNAAQLLHRLGYKVTLTSIPIT